MGGRTDINVAVSRLMVEALRIAKWAEKTGTPLQKDMMRQYVQVTVKVIRNIAPNYADYVIPVWQLPAPEYFTPPPETKPIPAAQRPVYDIAAMNAANQHEYDEGWQAAIDGKSLDDDNPHHWQDDKRWSAWNRGFSDQIKATNPEGNYD